MPFSSSSLSSASSSSSFLPAITKPIFFAIASNDLPTVRVALVAITGV